MTDEQQQTQPPETYDASLIDWEVDSTTESQIRDLVDRALKILGRLTDEELRLCFRMNLTACHLNGCPLDFDRMAEAKDFDFMHDVFGIDRHINHDTGKLCDMFRPRFARKDAA